MAICVHIIFFLFLENSIIILKVLIKNVSDTKRLLHILYRNSRNSIYCLLIAGHCQPGYKKYSYQ